MRLDSIQALRGLAAYLVLFYHIRALEVMSNSDLGLTEQTFVKGPFENGWAGVDLFFVISGFIMVYVTVSLPQTLGTVKDFALARAFRIFPPWWLFAGGMAAYLLLTYNVPWDAEALAQKHNTGLNHLVRSVFLLPQANLPILGVGWTLVHEVHFYIIFSLLLFAPRRLLPVWLGLWALLVCGGALLGWSRPHAENYIQLSFHPLSLEFICGAMAGWLIGTGKKLAPLLCFSIGAAAFTLAVFSQPPPTAFTLLWGRALLFSIPCALMVYGAAGLSLRQTSGSLSVFITCLGDWSFALYLSHMLTLSALRRIYPALADFAETRLGISPEITTFLRFGNPGLTDNIFFFATGTVIATTVAALTYYFFEQPILRYLNKFRHRQKDKEKARLTETTAP